MKSGAAGEEVSEGVVMMPRRRRRRSTTVAVAAVEIPYDLLLNILSRIPVKSLVRFKCVSKSWYNLLTHNSYFITMHLDQSIKTRQYCFVFGLVHQIYAVDYFRNPAVYKVDLKCSDTEERNSCNYFNQLIQGASCHGLFLFRRIFDHHNVLYLWNPGTRQHRKLPSALTQFPNLQRRFCSYIFGLGYDYTNNDYKVFVGAFCRSMRFPHCYECSNVHLYSLRTNSVKRIRGMPMLIGRIHTNHNAVFVKDSMHWLFRTLGGMFFITSYDVTKEGVYKRVPMPNITGNTSVEIGVLKDCLCFYSIDTNRTMNVVMMKEYGVKESWTILFTLQSYVNECRNSRPLFFNNNEQVILQVCPQPGMSHLVLFIPKERRAMYVEIHDLPDLFSYCFQMTPYVESLVSLKSTTFNLGN